MAYRIHSHAAALSAQRHLDQAQRFSERALSSLASGKRIVTAGDDAAGFAISENLRGQVSGLRQARMNAEMAMSLFQTAEGGLNEQNNILVRLRELAVYSASDTVGPNERDYLNIEFQQLVDEADRIAKSTRFGHKELLQGSNEEFQFQIGEYLGDENVVSFKLDANTTGRGLGIQGLEISGRSEARESLEELDTALIKLSSVRASFGAIQSRIQFAIDNLQIQAENIDIARSRIVDVDVAEAVSEAAKGQIMQEAATSVMLQANQNSARVIRLLA